MMFGAMPKQHSERVVKLAVSLYLKHQSGDFVMRKLDMPRTTVYRLLHKGGIDLPGQHSREVNDRKRKLQGEQAIAAAKDYAGGMTLAELCHKYKVGEYSIRTAVKAQKVKRRGRGGQLRLFTPEQVDEMVNLYTNEGMSQAAIAAIFETVQPTVSRELRLRGVFARSRKENSWQGGRTRHRDGYTYVWVEHDDPMASMRNNVGYVLEHRLVMARHLGRPLTRNETVHHKDEAKGKSHNVIENLQLRHGRHGTGCVYRCADCGSLNVVAEEL